MLLLNRSQVNILASVSKRGGLAGLAVNTSGTERQENSVPKSTMKSTSGVYFPGSESSVL